MNIDMIQSRSLVTNDERGARSVRALKFAVMTAAILACAEFTSAVSSQEVPAAPAIEQITGERSARFKEFLSNEGYENIQFVALAYGEGEQETLLVLQFAADKVADERFAQDYFEIPPVGTEFDEAVVLYTGSPAKATTCGAAPDGTRSCRRICPLGGTPYPCP